MAKEKLPALTEAQVRKLASAQSFERGRNYYNQDQIIEPERQGKALRALCAGSEDEPYEVSATLGKGGVAEASCTCPYDRDGCCKHIVALLLTYIHEPESFVVHQPVKTTLADRSKEELLEIINEMVRQEPRLRSRLAVAAAGPQPGRAMNVAAYRTQARRVMSSESPRAIERELKSLRDAAARLAKAGDWLNAGAIYHVALDEAVKGYDEMVQEMDYDGDICVILDELAEGLSRCLQQSQADKQTRRAWLTTMLEAELKDTRLGGIDLAPSAGEAVLKQATAEEWEWIAERLRSQSAKSRDWERESLVSFLEAGYAKRGQKAVADKLIRDLGTPEQQTHLLIREGRIAEALKEVRKIIVSKPGLVTEFADALLEAKARKEALELILEKGDDHWSTRDWLAKYYRTHGTPQEAIAAQQQVFLASPRVETFKDLQKVCQKTGAWPEMRAGALAELERKGRFATLIELALYEKNVPRALELLPHLGRNTETGRHQEEVARAAEKEYPQAALAIYQQLAEQAIEGRTRPWYARAATYLKQARKLAERLGAQTEWAAYLQQLRNKYAKLTALHEELRKAKL